jgi:WD40 repeat protein
VCSCLVAHVAGSKDSTLKLWDPKSGQCLNTLNGHKNMVTKALWNDNGHWIVSGSRDQLIKIWDIRTMKEIQVGRSAASLLSLPLSAGCNSLSFCRRCEATSEKSIVTAP